MDKMDMKKIVLWLTKEQRDELKKQLEVTEDILVPDCIKIEKECWCWDRLWIKFNESKQVLFYNTDHWGMYNVVSAWRPTNKLYGEIKCKLIPCKREDLKPWDTAYATNNENDDFKSKDKYCKILDDYEDVCIVDDSHVRVYKYDLSYWYKVVPVE